MSDPRYFGLPSDSYSAIGTFTIGVSAIDFEGDVVPFNWADTFISQYANSPILLQLITDFNNAEDQSPRFYYWYDNVWNILTAVGYGLDMWGRILGVGRALAVDDSTVFGFSDPSDTSEVGFGQEPFWPGPTTTANYLLIDDAYRLLLLAKAAANICDGSIPKMNRLLMNLFPNRGNAFVQEGTGVNENYFGFGETGDAYTVGFGQEPFYFGQFFTYMSMRYTFKFSMTPVEQAIITQSGVLPTPSGVNAIISINP